MAKIPLFILCQFLYVTHSATIWSQTHINHLNNDEIDGYVRLGWIDVDGEIEDAYSYWDSLGQNLVVLSKLQVQLDTTLEQFETPGRIFAYLNHFVARGDSVSHACQVLEYRDVSLEADGAIRVWRLKFADADSNGIMECYFAYYIQPDVTDCCYPSELKVIVHEGSDKYAIRGSSEIDLAWVKAKGEKHIDGFNSLLRATPQIQDYANSLFDKMADELRLFDGDRLDVEPINPGE